MYWQHNLYVGDIFKGCPNSLCKTINNTTYMYKIVWLSLILHPQNCKGNHVSVYINMSDGTIIHNFNHRCNDNTIHSLVIFSRVVPCHYVQLTLQPNIKLFNSQWNCIHTTTQVIICHCICIWMLLLYSNIWLKSWMAIQSIV